MTEADKALMDRYGITVEQKSVFTYRGYRYDRLSDAVNYARIESERREAAGEALE